MSGITGDVRSIIEELDADGGGFQTSEAAGLLVHQYVTAGICNADGEPKPKVRTLMRMGASIAFKQYRGGAVRNDVNRSLGECAERFCYPVRWLVAQVVQRLGHSREEHWQDVGLERPGPAASKVLQGLS